MLTQKDLKHLSGLARFELPEAGEEKLLKDLRKILEHFEELKELDTTGVEPMAGGTFNKNVFRDDNSGKNKLASEASIEAFPEVDGKFLKIPSVFE